MLTAITETPSLDSLPPTPAQAGNLLDPDQLGHLRHFDNISRLPDNDWSGMLQMHPGQEDGATLRYQLAYAGFALALTHLHRLPAAPGLFKPMFARLIDKLLLPGVWDYWRDVSKGGGLFNPQVKREKESWDPVARENIMYSGYVQSIIMMYEYLFDDHHYAEPESIVFHSHSPFFHGSEHRFAYDRESLNENLYWQMVENGYLGIACQPNCVFQVCIQPAILGFRMHDLIVGGSRATEVTRGYQRAWEDLGQVDEDGHFTTLVHFDSKEVVAAGDVLLDSWLGSLMNMWNPDLVRERYADLIGKHVYEAADGTLSAPLSSPPPGLGLDDMATPPQGWIACWAAEMGDEATLDGLIGYADAHLGRTWRDGGLLYPRNDRRLNEDGDSILMDPVTGNVTLGYARLNIPNGLWRMYNEPLAPGQHADPALTRVARDVDVSQAVFDHDAGELTFTVARRADIAASHDDNGSAGTVEIGRLAGRGPWSLMSDGQTVHSAEGEDTVVIECPDSPTTYRLVVQGGDDA